MSVRHILVAVDDSDGARRAAEFVERFFCGTDVRVTALNVAHKPVRQALMSPYAGALVWPWPTAVCEVEPGSVGDAMDREEIVAGAVAAVQAPAADRIEVVFGEAVAAITSVADCEDVDLIVVGSNHRHPLQRLLRRSVAKELARRSRRPVLIVP